MMIKILAAYGAAHLAWTYVRGALAMRREGNGWLRSLGWPVLAALVAILRPVVG